mmetsp:Transcript_13382/g.37003  ORF Transcript_13382/g.37003 Transcript_13382/m.37003 type:complete len:248 (-) Transcript_13382:291-1034(-)
MRSVQKYSMSLTLFSSVHLRTRGISLFCRPLRKRCTLKEGSSRLISDMHTDISVSKMRSPRRFDASLRVVMASSVPDTSGPSTAVSLSLRIVRSQRDSGRIMTPMDSPSIGLPATGPVWSGSDPMTSLTFSAILEAAIFSSTSLDFFSMVTGTSKMVSAAFMPISAVPRTKGLSTAFLAISPIAPPIFSRVGRVCSPTLSACFFASSAALCAASIPFLAASSASARACWSCSIATLTLSSSAVFLLN